jgi:hypothetical protein
MTSNAPPADARRDRKKPITATTRMVVGELGRSERVRLSDRLYEVYAETSDGASRQDFYDALFTNEDRILLLFHGPAGEIAGFVELLIETVARGDEDTGVVSGGVFFRFGYHGGARAGLSVVGEALRYKLRRPSVRLAIVARASTPVVYRSFASSLPNLHPAPSREVPPEIEALVADVIARRRYERLGDGVWRVRSMAVPRRPERITASEKLREDPFVRFYLEKNPTFAEDRSALMFWTPLDLPNLASAAITLARQVVFARRRVPS